MFQGQDTEIFLKLVDVNNVIVTGVTYLNMTVKTWNKGQVTLSPFTMAAINLVELGAGHYVIKLPSNLFPNTGLFVVTVSGSTFQTVEREYIVEPTPLSFLQSPAVCVVSGNIMEITGNTTHSREEISFRVSKVPVSVSGSLVAASRIPLYPDAYGNFSVQLLRFAEVIIEIKSAGINYKFTVPNLATAPLLSLLPPI